MNDDCRAPFMHTFNCITLTSDIVHIFDTLEVAYSMSCKLTRRSWMKKYKEVGLY